MTFLLRGRGTTVDGNKILYNKVRTKQRTPTKYESSHKQSTTTTEPPP